MLQSATKIAPSLPGKSLLGQYMTPPGIAAFMASLFSRRQGALHLLDPGAGRGALSRAFLDACKNGLFTFGPGAADAFEVDGQLLPTLRENLNE